MSLNQVLNLPYIRDIKNKVNILLDKWNERIIEKEKPLMIKQEKFIEKVLKIYYNILKDRRKTQILLKLNRFILGFFPLFIMLNIIQYNVIHEGYQYQFRGADITNEEFVDFDMNMDQVKEKLAKQYKLNILNKISKKGEDVPLIDLLFFSYYFSEERPSLSFILLHLAHLKNPDIIETNSYIDIDSSKESINFEDFISNKILE